MIVIYLNVYIQRIISPMFVHLLSHKTFLHMQESAKVTTK